MAAVDTYYDEGILHAFASSMKGRGMVRHPHHLMPAALAARSPIRLSSITTHLHVRKQEDVDQ